MKKNLLVLGVVGLLGCLSAGLAEADTTLYNQNFESPAAFVNDGGDVNIRNSINTLYGGQPAGFSFAQDFTVETLLITGNQAFGTGYSDISGQGGNYALGMLSSVQNDLLGLSFDVGTYDYFNVGIDISSIDLSVFGGPFVSPGDVPKFEFTLFDNPTGINGLGSGTVLDTFQITGTASAPDVFAWTSSSFSLDTAGNTNGNVTLRIDLLEGGYAALDNFSLVASDTPVDPVPEPATMLLFGTGLVGLAGSRLRKKK